MAGSLRSRINPVRPELLQSHSKLIGTGLCKFGKFVRFSEEFVFKKRHSMGVSSLYTHARPWFCPKTDCALMVCELLLARDLVEDRSKHEVVEGKSLLIHRQGSSQVLGKNFRTFRT
jgi:hypothetical protein